MTVIRAPFQVVRSEPTANHDNDKRMVIEAVWPVGLHHLAAAGRLEVILHQDQGALFPVGRIFTVELQAPPKEPMNALEES